MGALALARPVHAAPLRAVGTQFARVFEGGDGLPAHGLAVDVLNIVFGADLHCEFVPWPRAQLMLEQGEADILVGPYRTPERETRMLFSVRPLFSDTILWYVRRSEEATCSTDMQSLLPLPIAAVRGWAYGSQFERARPLFRQLTWVPSMEAGLQMLARGRVTRFAGNDRDCEPVLQKLGLEAEITRCPMPLDVLHSHMAFGLSWAGQQLAQRYDAAFEAWLHEPTAAEVYRRWNIRRPNTAA